MKAKEEEAGGGDRAIKTPVAGRRTFNGIEKILDRAFTVEGNDHNIKLVKGDITQEWTVTLTNDIGEIKLKGGFRELDYLSVMKSVRVQVTIDQTELPIEDEERPTIEGAEHPTTYKCKYCGDEFAKPLELAHHVRTTHRKELDDKLIRGTREENEPQ